MTAKFLSGLWALLWLLPVLANAGPLPEASPPPEAKPLPEVRVGVLGFGTVNWETNVIQHHGLDTKHGIALRVLPFASNRASQVALQSGDADVIVADWLLAARLRADGVDMSFVPYSTSIGSIMVPADSTIKTIADLAGKRIGVAGGPLDKSWLLLRAHTQATLGINLVDQADPVFGAPPLLSEEMKAGRLDAILTYWHYAARLEARGYRRLIAVADIAKELSGGVAMPSLGFVFSAKWAAAHPGAIEGLVAASRAAKQILATSDQEWERLGPRLRAGTPAIHSALRDGFRAGIPAAWGDAERQGAKRVFDIMLQYGGGIFAGRATALDPDTFWPHADF